MRDATTRRSYLRGTGAAVGGAGLAGLAGCSGNGGDGGDGSGGSGGSDGSGGGNDGTDGSDGGGDLSGETIRIGALQPTSGDLKYYGQISLQGFYSGLAYKHDLDPIEDATPGTYTVDPDGGPTYEIIVEDTGFSPDTAQSVATDLVLEEDIDILFGGTSSDSARRLIDTVVDETDVPYLIGPAADAGITVNEEFCHPLAFRASEHTAMDARAGGTYVAENFDIDTVAVFASDNAFGQSVASNYTAVLEGQGVEVLEPRFVEVGYSEFDGLFEQAMSDGATGVVGGFTASTLPQFLTSAISYDVQVFGGFAALLTTQLIGGTIESALGEGFTEQDIKDAGLGPFTSRYHWNQYENPINDEFRQMHIDAYGIVPDLFSAGTFTAASALSQAISESGSTDGADVADALRGMTVADTPKGADGYTFQSHNNQAASQMTVAWPVPTSDEYADTWGAPIMPGEPLERLDAEDVMVPEGDASCSL
ncbi:ABC transporter substrate-binding protein [Halorubrum halophilum]|uniref:ABC transporter substrate-binding protein n=1 Tax=Halorubrum halophilum TaxID=413816 RepID=UPI00186B3350|nr:ABC transporter substrate-binding protein [Halorubrum halophilum]